MSTGFPADGRFPMLVGDAGNDEAVAVTKVRDLVMLEHLVDGFLAHVEPSAISGTVIVVCCAGSPAMVGSDPF